MKTLKLYPIIFLLMVGSAVATEHYVSLNGTNNYPFTNWPDAATNIEWAVNVGLNGDTVWISNGTYVLTNQVTVRSNITICGVGGRPVIDGINSNRCFYFANTVGGTISNLFITQGYTNGPGAGVYMPNKGCVYNCVFSNNNALGSQGGGLYGATQVLDCVFVKNSAAVGGGGVLFTGGNIQNCIMEENTCYSQGGGVSIGTSGGTLRNCLIRNNCAYGTSGGAGGGVYFQEYYSAYIQNCTIVSNYAYIQGGGLGINNGLNVFVNNSIIYGNTCDTAANSNYWIASSGASFTNCCLAPALSGSSTNYSTNNISSDPMYINKTAADFRLAPSSPCINSGTNCGWMTGAFDLDGHYRLDPYSRRVDMGCYVATGKACEWRKRK
jgi:hypothetical protein